MTTIIDRQGVQFVNTTITLPRELRDYAKKSGISMSGEIRRVLEERKKSEFPATASTPVAR